MRLISQDGKFDIPYDEIVVEIFDECVVGRLKEYVGRDIILGSYSTEEKAEKAMEMLRKTYENNEFYHHTSTTDAFKDFASISSNEKFNELTSEYFQFPQDDEIEV